MTPIRVSSIIAVLAAMSIFTASSSAQTAAPPDHPPALSPAEAIKQFRVAEGLEIKLVAAEPQVAQPLSISFDVRGRMWVLQYRQYPNPNGLQAVAVDQYLRTKYDRLPEPPPNGPKGQDRISIYEDTDGDGQVDVVKDFVNDLNLASGMALGYDGVFVVQSPYLLFYADRDHDDRPDGPPKVLLTGFGMEDAHAFANSLTWGPDGWLYGAQGSTATADIRGIGFQQGIWRYHPRWDRFELFAEGGGNTWGVEFDRFGNLFAAGNTAEPLEHHVQGSYMVKGFGKHGPLHNPHTYGYFQPVIHHGYLGDSLSGGAIIYQGGAFPSRFDAACICPHTRHSACRWTTVETRGSTFATRDAGEFVVSSDIWFRPVDMTTGPDGAVYIADWYDYNISHSSPRNRSEWYQPSRLDGRVWRVAPPNVAPIKANAFDLSRKTSRELVELLAHKNDWYARQARQLLAERCDHSVVPLLAELLSNRDDQRLALQGLWGIYVSGAFDDRLAASALASPHEYVRAWAIRLLGDQRNVPPTLLRELVRLAREDESATVRSQLACTAKRLPASEGLSIVAQLLAHDEDADDPYLPLLVWWAVEDKAVSDTSLVLEMARPAEVWHRPLMTRFLIERIVRRLFSERNDVTSAACALLLRTAAREGSVDAALSGMLQALSGGKLEIVPVPLRDAVNEVVRAEAANPRAIELALRLGLPDAAPKAIRSLADRKTPAGDRLALITALGQTQTAEAIGSLLATLSDDSPDAIKAAALSALGYHRDDAIADAVLEKFARFSVGTQARAVDLLASRPGWAVKLAEAVDRKALLPAAVPLDAVTRLRRYENDRLRALIEKHWGKVQITTSFEKQGRIEAVSQLLTKGKGDAARGRALFEKSCATCHKLHGAGTAIGPDLTAGERKDRNLLVRNIVDPNSVMRQEFIPQIAVTKSGQVLTGLLAESTPETITLLDAKNQRTVLKRSDLEELTESSTSLMPEKLLDELTEQQIRDLIAYVQADG